MFRRFFGRPRDRMEVLNGAHTSGRMVRRRARAAVERLDGRALTSSLSAIQAVVSPAVQGFAHGQGTFGSGMMASVAPFQRHATSDTELASGIRAPAAILFPVFAQ